MILIEHDGEGRIGNIMRQWPPEQPEHLKALGRGFIIAEEPHLGHCMVIDGALAMRPRCPASVAIDANVVTINQLPEGSSLAALANGAVVAIPAQAQTTVFTVDEPGRFTLVITPPFPFLEATHDVSIEPF